MAHVNGAVARPAMDGILGAILAANSTANSGNAHPRLPAPQHRSAAEPSHLAHLAVLGQI